MKILRRIVFSFFILYSFNMVLISYNYVIPINIFSVTVVSILDIPGIAMLFFVMKLLM